MGLFDRLVSDLWERLLPGLSRSEQVALIVVTLAALLFALPSGITPRSLFVVGLYATIVGPLLIVRFAPRSVVAWGLTAIAAVGAFSLAATMRDAPRQEASRQLDAALAAADRSIREKRTGVAEELLLEALDVAPRTKDEQRQAEVFCRLGDVRLRMGRLDSAMVAFDRCGERAGRSIHGRLAQLGRARVLIELSRLTAAEGAVEAAAGVADTVGVGLFLIRAEIARLRGRLDTARAYLDSAKALSTGDEDDMLPGIALQTAELAHASSDDEEALRALADAASGYRRNGNWSGFAQSQNRIAEILVMRGSLAEAHAAVDVSLREQDPDDFRNRVRARQIRADVDFRQGRNERALAELRRGLDESVAHQYTRGEANTHFEIAKIIAHDDVPDARVHFERALELYGVMRDEPGEANSLLQIAQLDRRDGNLDAAAERAGRARHLFAEIGNPLGQANSGLQLAVIAAESGDLAEAREQVEVAHEIFHSISNANGLHFSHLIAEQIGLKFH